MDQRTHIQEERISLGGLIRNVQDWIKAMLVAWKSILFGAIIIGGLYFLYQQIRKVNYTAATTFVLETSDGGVGQLSSLASLAGVNLGSLTESSSLFQLDNITQLYSSYTIIKQTLLTHRDSGEGNVRLISWYGRDAKLLERWNDLGIDFEIPEDRFLTKHDSVLKEVAKNMRRSNLMVNKVDRKLSILKVAYTSDDELFAKAFNEEIVELVNDFYFKTKTKKTNDNLLVLSVQADSVKKVLDQKLLELARFEESNANLNPIRAQAQVPRQKIQIDIQSSSAVYQEIVKNLEIAKVAHRNNSPLIKVIDEPILPLENDKMKWYKALVLGLFVGGVLMVFFITTKRIIQIALVQSDPDN